MTDYFKDCTKCGGSGEYYSRKGYLWKCSACRGTGRTFASKAAREAYHAEKERKAKAWLAENAKWLVTVAFFYGATGNPVASTVLAWARRGKAPTPKMLAAVYCGVVRLLIKLATPPEETAPVIEGKGTVIEGEIVSLKWKDTPYGYVKKCLVKDARGFKVWGTVPKAIVETAETGSVVRFVANTKTSDNDECFGFFSRPRKAELLNAA